MASKLSVGQSLTVPVYLALAGLSGLILPMLLIFPINILGYSEVLEELAKTLVALLFLCRLFDKRTRILGAIILGGVFGLSESCLYFSQIFQFGDIHIFWQRLLLTVPMHIVAAIVIILPTFWGRICISRSPRGLASRFYLVFGFAGALILHLAFNAFVS